MKTQKNIRGYTLLESLFAIILIGITVVAISVANQAFTMTNGSAIQMSNAEFLIEQIREMTSSIDVLDPQTGNSHFGPEEADIVDYDDVDDFDGAVISPPVDVFRNSLDDLANYSQNIEVVNVRSTDLADEATNHSTDFYKITVSVSVNGNLINSSSWLRTID